MREKRRAERTQRRQMKLTILGTGNADVMKCYNTCFVPVSYTHLDVYKRQAFAGSVTLDASACNRAGIDAFFPIVRGVTTLEEAMDPQNAYTNMRAAVEQVFRLL